MSAFSELYPALRTLLGDTGTVAMYSTAQLDMGISNGLMEDATYNEVAGAISPNIASKTDKMILALRAAIALVSPTRNLQRYTTKVLSVTRDTGEGSYAAWLEGKLSELVDGTLQIGSDSEWDVFLRGTADTIADFGSFPG
ncbi:MAG: hypothetical protein A2W31_06800 [Planctomycetes bacterium RBG_16_64_10]|nr:MAG: hypothetical protein A2W31_06800 [Planctomycetes bacterium RBG_16_64_10]